jgi:Ni/Co efflux regulator RcnB
MKSNSLLVCAVVAATLGTSTASFAQGPMQRVVREVNTTTTTTYHVDDRRGDRRDARRDQRYAPRHDRRDARSDRRDHRPAYRPAPVVQHNHYYYNARGPEFKRGRHIPREYRNHQYVVTKPYQHRLAPPPRGHQWVQVGSDYVLIAIASGLIANVILSR